MELHYNKNYDQFKVYHGENPLMMNTTDDNKKINLKIFDQFWLDDLWLCTKRSINEMVADGIYEMTKRLINDDMKGSQIIFTWIKSYLDSMDATGKSDCITELVTREYLECIAQSTIIYDKTFWYTITTAIGEEVMNIFNTCGRSNVSHSTFDRIQKHWTHITNPDDKGIRFAIRSLDHNYGVTIEAYKMEPDEKHKEEDGFDLRYGVVVYDGDISIEEGALYGSSHDINNYDVDIVSLIKDSINNFTALKVDDDVESMIRNNEIFFIRFINIDE